jgi:hypothetical protein
MESFSAAIVSTPDQINWVRLNWMSAISNTNSGIIVNFTQERTVVHAILHWDKNPAHIPDGSNNDTIAKDSYFGAPVIHGISWTLVALLWSNVMGAKLKSIRYNKPIYTWLKLVLNIHDVGDTKMVSIDNPSSTTEEAYTEIEYESWKKWFVFENQRISIVELLSMGECLYRQFNKYFWYSEGDYEVLSLNYDKFNYYWDELPSLWEEIEYKFSKPTTKKLSKNWYERNFVNYPLELFCNWGKLFDVKWQLLLLKKELAE